MPIKFAVGAATALSTTRAVAHVKNNTSTDALAHPIEPRRNRVIRARFKVDTIAGGATQILWFVAADAAGDVPLTAEYTDTIVTGKTTATSGGCVRELELAEPQHEDLLSDRLHVVMKTNAGTCNASPYLYFT